jgi:uncharacterized membrane protein
MITESMTTQVLHVIFSALTPAERWRAARHPFGASSAAEGWLTVFAIAALITSVILMFWLSAKHRRSMERLKQEIAGLGITVAIEEVRQEVAQMMSMMNQQTPAEASKEMPSEELKESEEPVAIQKG